MLNFRNHRKMVVVDGKTGWRGGHNVGDEYHGKDPDFSPLFRARRRRDGSLRTGCAAWRREAFSGEMETMFEADFAHSGPIEPAIMESKPFWWRLGVNISRLAAPVLERPP